eukprot:352225-Chlamydomonas_euryale.AAC.8
MKAAMPGARSRKCISNTRTQMHLQHAHANAFLVAHAPLEALCGALTRAPLHNGPAVPTDGTKPTLPGTKLPEIPPTCPLRLPRWCCPPTCSLPPMVSHPAAPAPTAHSHTNNLGVSAAKAQCRRSVSTAKAQRKRSESAV